jgi:HEAT repeat protein
VGEAAPAKPDAAIGELSDLLRRQLVGTLTLNAGAGADSWRTLLTLLARPAEEVRADGGIAHLWATAGGPSLEIVEIDYAEVLREKQGDAAAIERVIAAALAGPQLELDDSAMHMLLDIVGDPARLADLMRRLEGDTADKGVEIKVAAFLNLLRGLAEYVGRTNPAQLDQTLRQMGQAAGVLNAESMLDLLARRAKPEAMAGSVNVVTAMVHRMSDATVAQFVSHSVIAERGASERLAEAFQALVPEQERHRQLLSLAQTEVAASELGQDETFGELWERVEAMLTSYSDAHFVSDSYGRELSGARARAIDVEAVSDDPPDRVAEWMASVADAALRGLDVQLLTDLLHVEEDASRWRDVADTAAGHVEDLVRVGYFDQVLLLAGCIVTEKDRLPARESAARGVLDRLGQGPMIKQVAKYLRTADDASFARFSALCQQIGPAAIPPLAEALSTEQDARARRRLRDVLVGFGAAGRDTVQQLMHATNWEVRRTAAYLLREFGGAEGLVELEPLLTDTEPLVQREAIQALVLNGTDAASEILLHALTKVSGRPRQTLVTELSSLKDERAAPLFCYLLRRLDRRAFHAVYLSAIEALGSFGGPDAVEALKDALQRGDWMAPLRTRRTRAAAAHALRRIGTPAAVTVLRDASTRGPRGARTAARTELGRLG